MAEAVVAPPNPEANQDIYDVKLFNRRSFDGIKAGKGFSKDAKAQKLALMHWLEALDPRHRDGHNLHIYYVKWLHCHSTQPLFYWLDIGAGKEVNLDRCPRSKLQQQCIKYLGPAEREAFEVAVVASGTNLMQIIKE